MCEHITVAVSLNQSVIGAKVWPAGSSSPAEMPQTPRLMQLHHVPVADFAGLTRAIEQLSLQPDRFPLRGDPVDPSNSGPQRRLLKPRSDAPATLRDVAKQQLLLDLDTLPKFFPEPMGLPYGQRYAAEVWEQVGLLVPELKGSQCWYAFTAGAGVKPGVRMRFAVWLAEAVTTAAARDWANGLEQRLGFQLFDPGLYGAAQPTYVAPPIFCGRVDHIAQRSGILPGTDCARLPPQASKTTRHVVRAKVAPSHASHSARLCHAGEAQLLPEAVERWLRTIAKGEVYRPIKAAVAVAVTAGCQPAAIAARILDVVAQLGDPGRVIKWQQDLPQLVSWTVEQEQYKRAEQLALAKPHPGCDMPAVSLAEAERQLEAAVQSWSEQALRFNKAQALPGTGGAPPRTLIGVTVGVGKTEQAVAAVAALQQQGLEQVAYLVPSHKLGDELAQRFRASGLTAQVWRGVSSNDEAGVAMCEQLELRDAAIAAGALKEACQRCPARSTCRYQAQFKATPAVWVAAHNFLFDAPPKPLRKAQAVIVDESFWLHALRGIDVKVKVQFSALFEDDPAPLRGDEARDLIDLRIALAGLLKTLKHGERLTRAHLQEWELGLFSCTQAYELEWKRKPDSAKLLAGAEQTPEALALALKSARGFNRAIPQLWKMVRELCELEPEELPSGLVECVGDAVQLVYRKPLHETWEPLPMLMLDATAQRQLVEAVVGPVEVVQVRAQLPAEVEVVQVRDQSMSRYFFHVDDEQRDPGNTTWRSNNRAALADTLEVYGRQAQAAGGKTVCILQKAPEQLVQQEAGARLAAADVELAHFQNIRGRDGWRDVRTLVVVGRTLPQPITVETIAEALFGRKVDRVGKHWPVQPVWLEGKTGDRELVEVARHPDPGAEAVRASICEGELVQAIGRARAVRRGPGSPLRVVVVGHMPVPGLVPDKLVRWQDIVPSRFDLIALKHGVLPLAPGALAAAGGWETAPAARKALQRTGLMGTSPLEEHLLKAVSPFKARWHYRLAGQRGKPSIALGPQDAAKTRAALERLVGELASLVEVEQQLQAAEQVVAAPVPQLVDDSARARVDRAVTQLNCHPFKLGSRLGVTSRQLRRAMYWLRRAQDPLTPVGLQALLLLRSREQVGREAAAMMFGVVDWAGMTPAQVPRYA